MRDFLLISSKPSARDFIDLEGQRFGHLTVLGYLPRRSDSPHVYWLCRCDCGTFTGPSTGKLRSTSTVSCGCYKGEITAARMTRHGLTDAPEYNLYLKIKSRCLRPDDPHFQDYGGRGISICDRWLNGEYGRTGFECFLADVGPRPSRGHSIDRIDNDGNYEPGNCRWATPTQQARNRRSNIYVTVGGATMSLPDACERLGLHYPFILSRMARKGWTFERAITQPRRGSASPS